MSHPLSRILAVAACSLFGACGGGGSPSGPATPAPTPTPNPPNLVVIMADDGDARSIQYMSKLQSLVTSQGTVFANSFATTPLCAPSRASFLSGQYAHNHGVLSNGPPRGGFEEWYANRRDESTIATWLKAAGYRTALFGKHLNNYPSTAPETYIPPGWDEWFGVMQDRRAELTLYTLNENTRLDVYRGQPEYQTDILRDRAVDFVRRAEGNDPQPFFMFVSVAAPHSPAIPADRHDGQLGDVRVPRTPSYNEDDVSDKPGYLQRTRQLTEVQLDVIDREYRDRHLTMLAVDDLVERLVQTLEATGELSNTYIFFTSDNGLFSGQHRLTGKAAPYEEAIRVPLIVRGPGVPAGRSLDHIVANIDLAPTLAELGRATAPDSVDGRSLRALLTATPPASSSWRRDLLLEYLAGGGGAEETSAPDPEVSALSLLARGMPDYYALRTETQAYVRYVNEEVELYDLQRDPDQLQNIQPGSDPTLNATLTARLQALRVCRGAACRN